MLDNKFIMFLVLYQTKSFTKTAQQLFVTQPAVSQQIQALQQELNVKLVDYHHSQLTFTTEGLKLAKLIEQINTQTQQGLSDITNPEKRQSISFGTTLSFNEMIEPDFIQQLATDYPKIHCEIQNTTAIINQLISGDIEFGLIEGNFDRQSFANILIGQDEFVGVCNEEHPFSNRTISIDELLTSQLLIREPGSGSRFIFENWLAGMNYDLNDFNHMISVGDIFTIQQLLSKNLGVSFMYRSAARSLPDSFHLSTFNLDNFEISHELNMVYLPGTPKEPLFLNMANSISKILSKQKRAKP